MVSLAMAKLEITFADGSKEIYDKATDYRTSTSGLLLFAEYRTSYSNEIKKTWVIANIRSWEEK